MDNAKLFVSHKRDDLEILFWSIYSVIKFNKSIS